MIRGCGREDLPEGARPFRVNIEFFWISQGDLFESHAVLPGGTRHVQVPVDDGAGAEAQVPVGGALGAAPLRELRVFQGPRWLAG
jgi:hypothetical protein